VPQPLLNFDHAYYLLAALMWLCLHGLPCWSKYLTSVNKWSGSARWMAFFTKFNYHSWNWLGFAHMLDICLISIIWQRFWNNNTYVSAWGIFLTSIKPSLNPYFLQHHHNQHVFYVIWK
jgi:hypothetical protein